MKTIINHIVHCWKSGWKTKIGSWTKYEGNGPRHPFIPMEDEKGSVISVTQYYSTFKNKTWTEEKVIRINGKWVN